LKKKKKEKFKKIIQLIGCGNLICKPSTFINSGVQQSKHFLSCLLLFLKFLYLTLIIITIFLLSLLLSLLQVVFIYNSINCSSSQKEKRDLSNLKAPSFFCFFLAEKQKTNACVKSDSPLLLFLGIKFKKYN
jgi:hypothetical protein